MRIDILKSEKAGLQTPISASVEIIGKITSVKLNVVLTTNKDIFGLPFQELQEFTVNGFRYVPSNKFNSVNTVQVAHIVNGTNIFTFAWHNSSFQFTQPDGKISAWLDVQGPALGFQGTDISRKISDWFKEQTPLAITVIVLVMVIVVALAYTTGKIAPKLPAYSELKSDVKSVAKQGKSMDKGFKKFAKSIKS